MPRAKAGKRTTKKATTRKKAKKATTRKTRSKRSAKKGAKKGAKKAPARPRVQKPRGRPSLFTTKVKNTLIASAKAGEFLETGAALAEVSASVVRSWLRQGDQERRRLDEDPEAQPNPHLAPLVRFSAAFRGAEAQADRDDLRAIRKAKPWQAHSWRLSLRNQRYRGVHRVEHSGPDGGPIPAGATVIDPAKLKDLSDRELELVAKLLGVQGADSHGQPGGGPSGAGTEESGAQ